MADQCLLIPISYTHKAAVWNTAVITEYDDYRSVIPHPLEIGRYGVGEAGSILCEFITEKVM